MTGCLVLLATFLAFLAVRVFAKDQRVQSMVGKLLLAVLCAGLVDVGALSVATGIEEWAGGRMGVAPTIAQVAWGAVLLAAGGIPGAIFLSRVIRLKRFERRRALHPDAPWLWRSEWSRRRLRYSRPASAFLLLLCVSVMAGGLAAISYVNRADIADAFDRSPVQVVAFYGIFCLILALGFVTAVQFARENSQYGHSTFERFAYCAAVGGELLGTVHTRMRHVPPLGFKVTLRCVRRELATPTRLERQTELWSQVKDVPAEQAGRDAEGVNIPVGFFIPPDAVPTDAWSISERVEWRLSAAATAGRVRYLSEFLVPVFDVRETVTTGQA